MAHYPFSGPPLPVLYDQSITTSAISLQSQHSSRIFPGLIAKMYCTSYCATKFGVEAFSESLRREIAAHGWKVKVSLVEPQAFNTPMTNVYSKKLLSLWNGLSDEMKNEYGEECLVKGRMRKCFKPI